MIANSDIDKRELESLPGHVSQFQEKFQWGQDTGKMSPKKIAEEITAIVGEERLENEETIFYSYETSLALSIALLKLSAKYPKIQFSLHLMDDGYWESLFSSKLLKFFSLRKSFAASHSYLQPRGRFTCNSDFASKRYRQLIGIKMDAHRAFYSEQSITSTSTISPDFERIKNQQKILVFFWETDLPFLRVALKYLFEVSTEIYFKCIFQIKSEELLNKFNNMLTEENLPKPKVIFGELSLDEYTKMITNASAALICYTDYYHQIGGSGRLVDCLCNGTPVIVPEGGALSELIDEEGGSFVYRIEDPKTFAAAISNFLKSEYNLGGSSNLRQELSAKSMELYSVSRLVNTLLNFHSQIGISTKSLRKSQFYMHLRLLELNWIILKTYETLKSRRRAIK
jgi:glycosyltransferase involved in cell wall biosynthesis